MKKLLPAMLFLFSCLHAGGVAAQTLDTAAKPVQSYAINARSMTMDELGNIYIVSENNNILRLNSNGDSTGFYRSALNGEIGLVDATNPLRILVYYPAFAKAIFLDRMLTETGSLDLHRLQILQAPAAAIASDGRLWVYDPFNARLLKLNESGERVRTSNDLRQQLSFVPNPAFLLERDRKVYACDTVNGVLIFDQFANYLTTIPIKGVGQLQVFNEQMVYRLAGKLVRYDLKTFAEQTLDLPVAGAQPVISAMVSPTRLAVLFRDRVVIYPWPLQR